MNKVSDLIIYKKYLDLIFYTEMITKKYPKYEKNCLVSSIKNKTYRGIELIIKAYKTYDKKDKIKFLNELDVHLKCIQIFIRVSLKNKYIKDRNYWAWNRKIFDISNLLGGWFNKCLSQ